MGKEITSEKSKSGAFKGKKTPREEAPQKRSRLLFTFSSNRITSPVSRRRGGGERTLGAHIGMKTFPKRGKKRDFFIFLLSSPP